MAEPDIHPCSCPEDVRDCTKQTMRDCAQYMIMNEEIVRRKYNKLFNQIQKKSGGHHTELEEYQEELNECQVMVDKYQAEVALEKSIPIRKRQDFLQDQIDLLSGELQEYEDEEQKCYRVLGEAFFEHNPDATPAILNRLRVKLADKKAFSSNKANAVVQWFDIMYE